MEPAADIPAISATRSVRDLVAATRKEEALWLLERLAPHSAPNNLSLAFRVDGKLEPGALQEALAVLVRRHDVLRTVYFEAGAELMRTVLAPDRAAVVLERIDDFDPGAGDGSDIETGAVERALTPFVARRFTLDGRPMLRAGLFRHADGHVVCLVFHHLIFDTISGTILIDDLVAEYERALSGRAPETAEPEPVPPLVEPEPKAASLDYWRARLADFDPAGLDLWCGTPDVTEPTLTGDQVSHVLSAEAREIVRRLQKELRAPEAVVLLAAYYLLLAAHGAGPDITVGSPVNVRPKDAQRAIGYHVNVLPLRVRVDPAQSFRQLVRTARDTYFDALVHTDVPVDSISGLVPRANSSWRNTLFRHLFNYVPRMGMPDFDIGELRATPLVVENGFSKFDLEFFVMSSPESIRLLAVHGTEALDRSDAQALLDRYEALLVSFGTDVDSPTGELAVWSEHDHAVIDAANRTDAPVRPASVLAAVHEHARTAPDSVAVRHEDRSATYGQLWACAESTRDRLLRAGVRTGDIVAIAAARTPELVAAVLGIWLAGGAYLPVDPDHPTARVSYLLTDSGARVIVTDRDLGLPADHGALVLAPTPVDETRAGLRPGELPHAVGADDRAYLIYTSGSTGRSKGALITHGGLANVAAHFTGQLAMTTDDTTLWMTTFAFDMSGIELHVPLYSGGTMVIAPDEARTDGRVLRDLIERYDPQLIEATPTTWRLVLEYVAHRLPGRRVITGGEPVPVTLAHELLAAGCRLHHAYGPTETTIWSTSSIVPPGLGDRLDVGRPIRNTRVMVVGPDGRRLPIGVRGELWIAGAGVALGYHDRAELTADRFGTDPVHGRYYRTGDLGRWRPDGSLELMGRADRQIKLRGNRVELGEVEAALLGHPRVRAAAVIAVGDLSSDGRLIAFVETTDGPAAHPGNTPADTDGANSAEGADLVDELWEFARGVLPRSTIPQDFVVLDALPTNANEKVDHLALGRLAAQRRTGAERTAAPAAPEAHDELLTGLLGLWRELLERDDVSADSNFFTHGGHSLLGAQLLERVEATTGVAVKLADLFTTPTPTGLADHIRATRLAA